MHNISDAVKLTCFTTADSVATLILSNNAVNNYGGCFIKVFISFY